MCRAVELNHPADWRVRAKHDRALPNGEKLLASVVAEKPLGQVSFHFRPRRGIKVRDVVEQLHVKRVSLSNGKRGTLEATCVVAREVGVAKGVKPVEWRLLTNRLVTTAAEAAELIDWYRARWEIEMYVDILKNGCKVEALQLRALPRLEIALAMFMIVAWRINRLMRLGRHQPDLDASLLFDADEIAAAYTMNRKPVPATPPKLNEVVRLIAMAGGSIGRKGDGGPGAKTLWQGVERVMSFVEGIKYARAHPESG